jgi:hypothetical protein
MKTEQNLDPVFVVKARELIALNYLQNDHPRPISADWINRGTNQALRRTTIELLLRTFFKEPVSDSIQRIRDSSGLRLHFQTEKERARFSQAFLMAKNQEADRRKDLLIAMFSTHDAAQQAIGNLQRIGVPKSSITLWWRAGRFMQTERPWPKGHSVIEVAKSVAGGGIVSALLGAGISALPGLGGLVALGAIAAVSGSAGAAGAAIAKMLTDLDVDDVAARYFELQCEDGRAFVSVDLSIASGQGGAVTRALEASGGLVGPID